MDEVEVTVRMPRYVFDAAVKRWGVAGYEPEDCRREAEGHLADSYPCDAAMALFRAAMLEHTPPWEPTEEQVTAYCERQWGEATPTLHSVARQDLIAAHAVLGATDG